MSIVIFIIIILFFYKLELGENGDYLSVHQTTCINGIFILLVFYRHLRGYVRFDGIIDKPMFFLDGKLLQLLVVMFLFNSGFGIAESIRNKPGYVKMIPIRRILNVWLQFAICVTLYIFIQCFRQKTYSIKNIALAYVGWTSVGNSNWYIMAILLLWFFTWLSFSINDKGISPYFFVLILTCVYAVCMNAVGKPTYRYDTVIAYPIGMLYSLFKTRLDFFLFKKRVWSISMLCSIITFSASYYFARRNILLFEIAVIAFAATVVLTSMRMKIGNDILFWLGKNLFGLYMLQRIPMIILADFSSVVKYRYLYALLCFGFMLLFGWCFNCTFGKMWNKIVVKNSK